MKQWLRENPEYMEIYNKKYYMDNKENNKEKHKKQYKQWYKNNLIKVKEYRKKYGKKWRKENPEYNKEYTKNRRKIDLKFNLNHRIGCLMRQSLKGIKKNNRHWENLVDYTVNDLTKRLKRTLPKGYTWNDFLQGKLHIDHIIPKSIFNFDKPEHIDFRRCWALSNLQLLPEKENITKNAKLTRPFQIALKL